MAAKKMTAKKTGAKKKSSDTYIYNTNSPDDDKMYKRSAKERSQASIRSLSPSGVGEKAQRRANMYGNVFTAITGKKATTKNTNNANPVQRAAIEAILRRADAEAGNKGLSASYARSKQGKASAAAMKSARASAKRAAKKK